MNKKRRRRRSRIELYVEVLRAINKGRELPSRVVYAANLSYDRVMHCIKYLIDQGLIRRIEEKNKKRYFVTEPGLKVINYFNEVKKYTMGYVLEA